VIVDSLTFVGDSIFGGSSSAADVLAALDAAGVGHAIVCPAKPPAYHLAAGNDAVRAGRRSNPPPSGRGDAFDLAVDPQLVHDLVEPLRAGI